MSVIVEFLGNSYIQALFWLVCVVFAFYFAYVVKKMSFGDDTGTKAWGIIAIAFLIIGFRVSFKIIFPAYKDSYSLQATRYILGLIGVITLYWGFRVYQTTLRKMYGVFE